MSIRIPLEMRFDPKTIQHLGLKMYSTLPSALAELISNAYDADASCVTVRLREDEGVPLSIEILDDGHGLDYEELQDKFLLIGRNRREGDEDSLTPRFRRKCIGKKGLGKLAVFGIASRVMITTRKGGVENSIALDWSALVESRGAYRPEQISEDSPTNRPDGTEILLENLKRTSQFDVDGLLRSLARMFVFDAEFAISVEDPNRDVYSVSEELRYDGIERQFEWHVPSETLPELTPPDCLISLSGTIFTSRLPLSTRSGLRGITLYSRGKLVNSPESFRETSSSHFFQYLSGTLDVSFIDELGEDVISTNRQTLDWENPALSDLSEYLSIMVQAIHHDWRMKRMRKKEEDIEGVVGIEHDAWVESIQDESKRNSLARVIQNVVGDESIDNPVDILEAVHELVPQYADLHWRHLNAAIKERVGKYYENGQYGEAAEQAVRIYQEIVQGLTRLSIDGDSLMARAYKFKFENNVVESQPLVQIATLDNESGRSMQRGQQLMSQGVVAGFRNPMSHSATDSMVPHVFSYSDCLDILSLVSFLVNRLGGPGVENVSAEPSTPEAG